MGLLLTCLIVGLVVLYKPVRRVIFQGVFAVIVGAVVLFVLAVVLVALVG